MHNFLNTSDGTLVAPRLYDQENMQSSSHN